MLIPRFSLRWLLALTTVCGAVSLVLASAVRGELWAIGMMAAASSLALLAALYSMTFLAAWLVWRGEARLWPPQASAGESPFQAGVRPAPLEITAEALGPVRDEPPPTVSG